MKAQHDWYTAIKPGDEVKLRYTGNGGGSHRIPMYLDGTWAIVLRRNTYGHVVAHCVQDRIKGYYRTLQRYDIAEVRMS